MHYEHERRMDFKPDQLLVKTPQGVTATRNGAGLSAKSHAVLSLFDGTKSFLALRKASASASISAADFMSALIELKKTSYVRVIDPAEVAAAAEQKMLDFTLDFTLDEPPPKASAAVTGASSPPPVAVAAPAAMPAQTAAEVQDRTAKAAQLKQEAEIRQKLVVALQPRVEEELRARLLPKLEQEMRPKLVAALRPGIEAEMRADLIKQLTPRVEVELKARFAKSLAAQRASDQQSVKLESVSTEPLPLAVPSVSERVLASMSVPVFSVDHAGLCTYLSPAWAQFSGYTAEEATGKPLSDFFAQADQRAVAALLNGIATGTALRFDQQGAFECKHREPLWAEINGAPLLSLSGEVLGVCGTIRDAEESRRIAEHAEADGVRLLLLVDQVDTGVILEDRDGNIQQTNAGLCLLLALDAAPYSLEGTPVSELLERASKGFMSPDAYLQRIAEMRQQDEDVKGESFIMADGRVVHQDYLAVTVGEQTLGRLWLYREMPRTQPRPAA